MTLLGEIGHQAYFRETLSHGGAAHAGPESLPGGALPSREACKLKAILRNAAASTTEAIISAIPNAFIVKAPAYNSKA
jgi:hypothetical protein